MVSRQVRQQQQQQQQYQAVAPVPLPIGPQAYQTFVQAEQAGPATSPLEFEAARVLPAARDMEAALVDPETNQIIERCSEGVIYCTSERDPVDEEFGFWPVKKLQDAIFGSVWCCIVVLKLGQRNENYRSASLWHLASDPPERVAIKILDRAYIRRMRDRFMENPVKEIAAMQHIQQPTQRPNQEPFHNVGKQHVLEIRLVLQDAMSLYCVMPFCPNGDLFDVVSYYTRLHNNESAMPEPVARYCFRQILWGLHYLQQKGICHRDLSLENVMLDGAVCKVIDFGMSLQIPYDDPNPNLNDQSQWVNPRDPTVTDVTRGPIRRLMTPQGTCGKNRYMSPEVRRNRDAMDGHAVDLWCVGIMLYIMIVGAPPFNQGDRTDPCYRMISVRGRLQRQLEIWGVTVSAEAVDLLQNMLHADPRQRFTLAQALNHPWTAQGPAEPPESGVDT